MADDFVDRSAEGFGELVVIVRGGIRSVFDDEVMHFCVDLVGGDTRPDEGVPEIEGLAGEDSDFSQDFDVLDVLNFDVFLEFGLLLFLGDAGIVVIWLHDMLGDGPLVGHNSRPEGP